MGAEAAQEGRETRENRSSRLGSCRACYRLSSSVPDDLTRGANKTALSHRLWMLVRLAERPRPETETFERLVPMNPRQPQEVNLQYQQEERGDRPQESTIQGLRHSAIIPKVRSCTRRIQPFPLNSLKAMAGVEGFEPPTLGLENRGKSPDRRFKSLILRALLSRLLVSW